MIRRIAPILATCFAFPAISEAKMAEVSCDDSTRLHKTLTQVLGAERQGSGLRDPDTVLEIWVTPRNGDWLVVQNYANGTSCVVAMGEHWEKPQSGPA